jgi:hypothetical protein
VLKQIIFEVENVTKIQLSPPEKKKKGKKEKKGDWERAIMGWMKCLFLNPKWMDG